MADNYLERRYEDYLVKKAAWERAKKLGILKKKINGGHTPSKETLPNQESEKKEKE
ncbi:MAG: hypothetical protein IK005_08275 [Paludibacteraceae bacterium]|nr:hypothetical protein [Paludibacteraceae bacterium]